MTPPAIDVEGLRKAYGDVLAVDDVSFRVEPGEYFGLLGPNGAGKSTTIRILTTLTRPDAGVARVAGHDVTREPSAVRAAIGLVSDRTILYPRLTVRENLRFFGRLQGLHRARAEARLAELLDVVDLRELAGRRVGRLSAGQRQRANIARALMPDPRVLLLDEPTLGLDVQSQRAVRELTQDLCRRRGTTVVLTTHQMAEADLLCGRVAVLHRGRVAALDRPAALKRRLSGGRQRVLEVELRSGGREVAQAARTRRLARTLDQGEFHLRLLLPEEASLDPLLALLRENGKGITHLRTTEPSLEDVFLALTGGEAGPERPATAAPARARLGGLWPFRRRAASGPPAAPGAGPGGAR